MYKQKIVLGISRFASSLFKNISKGDKLKIVLAILRFASIAFKYLQSVSVEIVLGIFRLSSLLF